jgi:hypothetical protein
MKPAVITDLKTERIDVGQPLPAALRLLPVAFFASILGVIGISGYATWQIKVSQDAALVARRAKAAQDTEIARIKTDTEAVKKEVANANEVKDWVLTTNQMQPMVTAITKAMTVENSITQISLKRREEMSSQIEMALQLTVPTVAKGAQQVDQIRTAVAAKLGMRSYSEDTNQTKGSKGEISFGCVWIQPEGTDAKK